MDLTSNALLILVSAALIVFYLVPRKFRWTVLLLASIVYYAGYGITAISALIFSAFLTFLCAYLMPVPKEGEETKKTDALFYLIVGLSLNLAMLLYLKYTGFLFDSLNRFFSMQLTIPDLLLPAGISYYTLQTCGYLVDVYRGSCEKATNPFQYLLFVLYFPQIAQGPIARFPHLYPQLIEPKPFRFGRFKSGIVRIAYGLFKKMLLADWLTVFRTAIFEEPEAYAGITIFGVVLYSLELYGNFSGGIDMMRGVSELFGVIMDENFEQPYLATSTANFWRRWHMSLGRFFRSYVYIPLGGNRKGTFRTAVNTFIVFFLSGIWHGASWAYVVWGSFHGVICALGILLAGLFAKMRTALHMTEENMFWRLFRMARTFGIISFGWYFFCVTTFEEFALVLRCSVSSFNPSLFLEIPAGSLGTAYTPYALMTAAVALTVVIVVSVLREHGIRLSFRISKLPLTVQFLILLVMVLPVPLLAPTGIAKGFIYAAF
ncbi:MAG: MBOAT family protein [Lachnospiraceae bacterium]|nr:MBOAT family protein [Lachnospiraceae bacterium]